MRLGVLHGLVGVENQLKMISGNMMSNIRNGIKTVAQVYWHINFYVVASFQIYN